MLLAAVSTAAGPVEPGWWTYADTISGTQVEYPAGVFSVAEGVYERVNGERFGTPDGRAHFAVFTMPKRKGNSPAAFIARNLRVPRASLHYERIAPNFFAISGINKANIYYSRCNASADRAVLHCIYLIYPAKEKRAWDGIVTRISRTLRPAS